MGLERKPGDVFRVHVLSPAAVIPDPPFCEEVCMRGRGTQRSDAFLRALEYHERTHRQ